MNNNQFPKTIKDLNCGCDDKSSHGEKCNRCIYNVAEEEKVSCIFSEIE